EALEHRRWQPLLIDGRHERGTRILPEWHCREDLPPPPAPTLEAAAIYTDELFEPPHPRRSALVHDGNENDRCCQVDLGSKKTQRSWRLACATAMSCTAQAEAPIVLGS